MKILYVATVSGTINAFLMPHIRMLVDLGHTVDIACHVTAPMDKRAYEYGCGMHEISFSRSPFHLTNYKAYKELKSIIEREEYDIVHTHTPVASAIVRLVCKRNRKIKVFYTAHGFHFFKNASLKNWLIYYPLEKWLSNYTDTLITINEEDYIRAKKKKFKAKNITLINGVGIDLSEFKPQTQVKKMSLREQYGYEQDDFIIIYVGELSYRKHQGLIINVASRLRDRVPSLKVLIVGSGELEHEYKEQVKRMKLEKQVKFLGFRKDVVELMNLADIGVSTSKQEGLPVNIMEAMATGLPLVVTDCRGNRDLVTNNQNGYIVGLDDIEKFADSIEILYRSEEKRKKIGNANLKKIQNYSINRILEKMKNIYS